MTIKDLDQSPKIFSVDLPGSSLPIPYLHPLLGYLHWEDWCKMPVEFIFDLLVFHYYFSRPTFYRTNIHLVISSYISTFCLHFQIVLASCFFHTSFPPSLATLSLFNILSHFLTSSVFVKEFVFLCRFILTLTYVHEPLIVGPPLGCFCSLWNASVLHDLLLT